MFVKKEGRAFNVKSNALDLIVISEKMIHLICCKNCGKSASLYSNLESSTFCLALII